MMKRPTLVTATAAAMFLLTAAGTASAQQVYTTDPYPPAPPPGPHGAYYYASSTPSYAYPSADVGGPSYGSTINWYGGYWGLPYYRDRNWGSRDWRGYRGGVGYERGGFRMGGFRR